MALSLYYQRHEIIIFGPGQNNTTGVGDLTLMNRQVMHTRKEGGAKLKFKRSFEVYPVLFFFFRQAKFEIV